MRNFRKLLRFVTPYLGTSLVTLVFLALVVAMDLAIPRLIEHLIDEGIAKGNHQVVIGTALWMLGISLVSLLLAIANNAFSVRVGEAVARDLREALFLHIQRYSFGNLDSQKAGQLLVRLTSDVTAVKGLIQISLRIGTRAPLMMLGSLILMVQTSPRLALTLVPLLGITGILIGFFVMRTEPMFLSLQAKSDVLNGVLQENISGARLVKSLVRADFEAGRFEHANTDMTEAALRVARFMSSMTPALTLCVNIGTVVVIWAGGMKGIQGELSLGQVVAFTNYLLSTMTPLIMMTMLANVWAAGLASSERIASVFETVPQVQDKPGAHALPTGPVDIALEDVTFAYGTDAKEMVLRNVSARASSGQTLAILGATGAGKSSLMQLLPRFYDVTEGAVLVAGQDVRDVRQADLLDRFGVVPQESILFAGSIRDNIRYGNPAATDGEVEAAAQAAQAHDFITCLPGGYDALVAPRGANFSGGQKQRLAIARALLVNPRVLILDDSTSAVDVETETKIQRALARDRSDRLVVVVAQRISTVLNADRILVLDRGRVVGNGTHAELLATNPVYQEIYASQLGNGTPTAGAVPNGAHT